MTRLIGSAEFAGLVDAASRELRIPPGDIENDIWVVEVLRSIVRPIEGARVVFKGGTSLSKAYGLIERFSEDVDLLIVANAGIGAGQLERVLKTLPRRAAEELGIETKKKGESDRGVHRTERLHYSAVYPDAGRVTPGVLLEMGIRGGPEPAEVREIRSYAAEWAIRTGKAAEGDFEEFSPVEVVALRPERTDLPSEYAEGSGCRATRLRRLPAARRSRCPIGPRRRAVRGAHRGGCRTTERGEPLAVLPATSRWLRRESGLPRGNGGGGCSRLRRQAGRHARVGGDAKLRRCHRTRSHDGATHDSILQKLATVDAVARLAIEGR